MRVNRKRYLAWDKVLIIRTLFGIRHDKLYLAGLGAPLRSLNA